MSDCTSAVLSPALSEDSALYWFTMATVVLFPVVILLYLFWFLALRESFTLLRKRETSMLYMSVLGTFTFWSTTVLYDIVGAQNFPCALFALLVYLGCPFTGGPILVKTLRYSSRVALQKLRENPELDLQADSSWRTIVAHLKFTVAPRSCSKEEKIMNAKFSQTPTFWIIWVTATFVPYFVAYFIKLIVTPQWSRGCSGCDLDMTDCIILIVINSFNVVLAILGLASHTRSKRDPLRIFRECLWALALPLCLINVSLILYLAVDLGLGDEDQFRFRSLMIVAPLACVYIQTLHQVIVARMLKVQILTSDRLNLEDRLRDVRADKDLRRDFQQYLYSELSGETLHFLDAVDAFRTKDNAQQLSAEALVIYNRFISRNRAPEEINLPSAVRNAITVEINQQQPTATMFDGAYADAKANLLQDGFARYIHKINAKLESARGSSFIIMPKSNKDQQVEC